MTAPRNQTLWDIVAAHVPFDEGAEALYAVLIQREDESLDYLRLNAANQGLMPSITTLILSSSGLGTPPTAEVRQQLEVQARAEQEQINEAIRRHMERGGGDVGPSQPI